MTNPWVAVITGSAAILAALFALIGVHYGQWLTTRREREHRLEQWEREDRLRFADHKRELYAEYLAAISRWKREVSDIAFITDLELPKESDGTDPYSWALKQGYASVEDRGDAARKALMRVRLVAPREIWAAGAEIIGLIAVACRKVLYEGKAAEAEEDLNKVDPLHHKIAEMMRMDLTG